ncbi:hypothetical protein I4U23_014506 [Adineta vaga]|nr:hypothetical protein I4U23_014506 [Adineta vaga]
MHSQVSCDFEIDECAWTLNMPWRIYPSGSTPDTASSGPTMDHTTANGNYVRFMANLLPETDNIGMMNTSVYLQNPTRFTFWYFMHGTRIGTLAFVVNNQTEWEKSGRQGFPAWYQANITLNAGEELEIAIVANRPDLGRSSDIAIDDIVLEGEPMPIITRTPKPTSTTTPRTRFNASCDFDVNEELCGWKSDTKYGWKVIHEREENITIGPSSDYSSIMRSNGDGKLCKIPFEENSIQYYYCIPNKQNYQCKGNDNKWFTCRDGGFVQIQTNQFDDIGERSQFDSPVLDALSDEGCVQFHYNIAGSDNDWLNVYVEDYWSGEQTCMWHTNGSSIPDRWIAAESPLRLETDGRYKIVFEAQKGTTDGLGIVSLDHIVVSSKRCSGGYSVLKCPSESISTTTVVTEITTILMTMTTTSITTPITTSTITLTTTSTTTLTTTSTTTVTTTVSTTKYSEDQRNTTEFSSSTKGPPIVPIVAGVVGGVVVLSLAVILFIWREPILLRLGLKHSNRITISTSYKSTPDGNEYNNFIICPTVTCDFEIDECAWTLDSTWKIFPSGSTPDTASSGPTMDHTTANGSYARFMAARLSDSSAFGVMSTNRSIEQSTSISFWYFMHGTQIGTLALLVNDNSVWQKSGRQGFPAWYQATVPLSAGANVKLAFHTNRTGLGRSSDIAIDDIVLQGEPAPISTRTTRPPSTTTPRTRFNASCDFDVEKELCGWKSDTKYGWKVIHEREANITIGPSSDYSSISERSQFDSPVLDALSEEGCVQFHYNIAGSDNDWLNVYVEDYWSGEQTCMWHTNGSNSTDIEHSETSTIIRSKPKGSSVVGSIVGSVLGVCVLVLIISMYVNRQKIHTRFSSKSDETRGIVAKYSNSNLSEDFVRLENMRERTTSSC